MRPAWIATVRLDQDHGRSAGPDRATVCHQHPSHPQHRHGGHVGNQNGAGLAVTGAEESRDQLARDEGGDSDRSSADQRGEESAGRSRPLPVPGTGQEDRVAPSWWQRPPTRQASRGRRTDLPAPGEHPVGNEEVLVLDDHQHQEGQRSPLRRRRDAARWHFVGDDGAALVDRGAVVAHGGVPTGDLECGEPGDGDPERAPYRARGCSQGEPRVSRTAGSLIRLVTSRARWFHA